MAGILEPTSGEIEVRGRVSALLELGAGFHPDLTGRENVYLNGSLLGLTRREMKERFPDIVAFSELEEFIDTPVGHYSSGMSLRLGFAVAVHTQPEVLLVDEVLAVGDASFQRRCLKTMRAFQQEGKTIVLVTHDPGLAADFCHRALILDRGRAVAWGRVEEVLKESEPSVT